MTHQDPQHRPPADPVFTDYWLASQHALGGFVRLHVRNHNHADDIIQEVARQATEHFDQYDPSRPFIAWLIGIARQRIAESYRKQGTRPVVFSTDVIESLTDAYAQLQDETSDRLEGLRNCMDQLSDRHRRVIELRYSSRKSSTEIAEQVGGSAGSIDVMLHRIRTALRTCVKQYLESNR